MLQSPTEVFAAFWGQRSVTVAWTNSSPWVIKLAMFTLRITSGTRGGPGGRDRTLAVNGGNNNGKLRIANATTGGARKAAWAKII